MELKHKGPYPKMSRTQAKIFWQSLTPQQRIEFNKMMEDLVGKKLQLTNVTIDDNEQIQRIVLDHKDKPGKPADPFYKFMPKIVTPQEK